LASSGWDTSANDIAAIPHLALEKILLQRNKARYSRQEMAQRLGQVNTFSELLDCPEQFGYLAL
jgi:hypothetical protein